MVDAGFEGQQFIAQIACAFGEDDHPYALRQQAAALRDHAGEGFRGAAPVDAHHVQPRQHPAGRHARQHGQHAGYGRLKHRPAYPVPHVAVLQDFPHHAAAVVCRQRKQRRDHHDGEKTERHKCEQ